MGTKKRIFTEIPKIQLVEFGLVAIMVTCGFAYWFDDQLLILVAIILCLISTLVPVILYPFAALWFAFSRFLSVISSSILLGSIFIVVVAPIGLFRRLMKKDNMKINQFKKETHSVLIDRDHRYKAEDFEHTF